MGRTRHAERSNGGVEGARCQRHRARSASARARSGRFLRSRGAGSAAGSPVWATARQRAPLHGSRIRRRAKLARAFRRRCAGPAKCLEAMALAADQLTVLHRASLLHGDIKPANIIVGTEGEATLVDFGLAAPWREGGAQARRAHPALRRARALHRRQAQCARGDLRARSHAR